MEKAEAGIHRMREGESKTGPKVGGEVDPSLAALVDRTGEGFRFRKDLPFPGSLEVTTTIERRYDKVRSTTRSQLGDTAEILDGSVTVVMKLKREDDRVSVMIEKSGFQDAVQPEAATKKKTPPPPPREVPELGFAKTLSGEFLKKGSKWTAQGTKGGDFGRMVWLKAMEPGFEGFATRAAVVPQAIWFGAGRFRQGTSMTLADDQIAMLFAPGAKGKVRIQFEDLEAVGGHPCGRFSLQGECHLKNVPDEEGTARDVELSIVSGKVWFSLLHPMMLRQEVEAVQTLSGMSGGRSVRIQGRMVTTTASEWKPGA